MFVRLTITVVFLDRANSDIHSRFYTFTKLKSQQPLYKSRKFILRISNKYSLCLTETKF